MGSRVAIVISMIIVLSSLVQPMASSGDVLVLPASIEGSVVIDSDWEVSNTVQFLNATIYLTGNLTITTTGNLEFVNTTLIMNLSEDGEFNIRVEGDFTMSDYDSDFSTQDDMSQIVANNTGNEYVIMAISGSYIDFNNSLIRDCGYSYTNNGLKVQTNTARFQGMTFLNNYCALYVSGDGAVIQNSVFIDNYRGLELSFAEPVIENLTITGSTNRGIYAYYSSPEITNCQLDDNRVGMYIRNSEPEIINCRVSNSTDTGIYNYWSSPLIQDTHLSNVNDMELVTDSFPRLLNSTFNDSSVMVGRGLFAHVGNYVDVLVVNETGSPMQNMTIAVLDDDGNPASRSYTNSTGHSTELAYREYFITQDGQIPMSQHEIIAFAYDGSNVTFGNNITTLSPGSQVIVEVAENPPDVEIWDTSCIINEGRNYSYKRIIALGDVSVIGGAELSLNNCEIMIFSTGQLPRTFHCGNSFLNIINSNFSSIGVEKVLKPACVFLKTDPDTQMVLENVELHWLSEMEINTGQAVLRDIDISHASIGGLNIIGGAPNISNLTINWTAKGINLAYDYSTITNSWINNTRDYGIHGSNSRADLINISVDDSSKGFYDYQSQVSLINYTASNCEFGVYGLYSKLYFNNARIVNSSLFGLYLTNSEMDLEMSRIINSNTGIFVQNSEVRVCDSNITGGNIGLHSKDCGPVVLDSEFSNAVDVKVERGSFASLVNCTLDPSNTSIEPSGYIDLGNWAFVQVVNQSFDPIVGCNISILDSMEEVAGSGLTGQNGLTNPISYRETRILWNTTENHVNHDILAFKGNLQGTNHTTISPWGIVQVQIASNGLGWLEWTGYRTITACEQYFNKTIIAHDTTIVDGDGCLRLQNCKLWYYGSSKTNLHLEIKSGTFEMLDSQLKPIAVSAPLQPFRFWLTMRGDSDGFIIDSEISGLYQVTTYSGQYEYKNSSISDIADTGLHVGNASPVIEDMKFYRCHDGLFMDTSYGEVANSSFVECVNNGFYAQGGECNVTNCQSVKNNYGFAMVLDYDGHISDSISMGNNYGFHVLGASISIDNSSAMDNTEAGFYFSSSYSMLNDVRSLGNKYGVYCSNSWPDIYRSDVSQNTYGIYVHSSGPFLQDCQLDGNQIGFYDIGGAEDFTKDTFSNGLDTDYSIFVDGGMDDHITLELPARSIITEANIRIRGVEIGDDAILEDDSIQLGADIHGEWVVWQNYLNDDWEIFAYNLSVDSDSDKIPNYLENPPLEDDPAHFRVTDNPFMQRDPAIHGDTIVWSDLRDGTYDIYAYTFTNDTTWKVYGNANVQRKPAIYGDRIVWEDYSNGNYDIFMFNITEGEVSQLSTSARHDMGARIWGDFVVWHSYSGSPGSSEWSDIIMFDIEAWKQMKITDDDPLQYEPDIYKNNIVWHDQRNGNWEIYHYDINNSLEQRLTFEVEQSFCPRMHGDKIVYYYHHRIDDTWSVRMYDMATGNQTILEEETDGDSRPVIYDHRAAWVNKSNGNNDIHVLDFNLDGKPRNVTVDIGNDMVLEFNWPGELNHTEFMNGTLSINALNRYLDRKVGGTTEIPISINGDGTGRVYLDIVSLIYDVPTYVFNVTMNNSGQSAVRCSNSGPNFVNSTLTDNPTDFTLMFGAWPSTINSTFNDSKLVFYDKKSNLSVKNFLHVGVENLTGVPINANVEILDNNQTIANSTTGSDGEFMWSVVTDGRYNSTGFHDNITTVNVSLGNNWFNMNPRNIDMAASHWEFFATDDLGPVVSNAYPAPYWTSKQLRPVISAHITDNIGIVHSSIQLYIQGFAVLYNSVPIPGGYNISYSPPINFTDLEIVHCQLYGEDTYGNTVNYTWEFKIDTRARYFSIEMQAGWNLISIPFDTYNQTVYGTLATIKGKYDLVRTYSSLAPNGPWFSYSPNRLDVFNDEFQITRKIGLWVHMTEACTFHVSGIPQNTTLITLNAGWNLVGYTILDDNRTLSNALWGTGADQAEGFDLAEPYLVKELGPGYIMKAGEGYWVHVPADVVWVLEP